MNLVVGSAGSLGCRVAEELVARGERVRMLLRSPPKRARGEGARGEGALSLQLARLKARGAEFVFGSFDDPEGLADAMRGARCAVCAVTAAVRSGEDSIETLYPVAAGPLVQAAASAGLERIVYLAEGSAGAEAVLAESGVGYTLLRPVLHLAGHSEAQLFGEGGRRIAFLPLAHVAALAARAASEPQAQGRVLLMRAEALLYDELLWAVEEAVHRGGLSGAPASLPGLAGTLSGARPLADALMAALVMGADLKLVTPAVAQALGLTFVSVATFLEQALGAETGAA